MLVREDAVVGSVVPFQVGETAKSSMLAFKGVDVFVFICGKDSRDVDLVRDVAVLDLRRQRTENKYVRETRRNIFLLRPGLPRPG